MTILLLGAAGFVGSRAAVELIEVDIRIDLICIPYELAPRSAGDIAICCASTEKAEKLLGWKAVRTIEDACRDAWRWEKNCGE